MTSCDSGPEDTASALSSVLYTENKQKEIFFFMELEHETLLFGGNQRII